MKSLAPLLTLLGLAACVNPASYGPDSPYYAYPAGGRFVLNQALAVEPGSATVRLQFGRVVPRNGVQELQPYCIFEVNTVREQRQPIHPDTFDIVGVRRSVSTIGSLPAQAGPIPVAFGGGIGLGGRVGFDDSGSPSHIYYKTEFFLRSAQQPDVRAMTCQSNQMAPGNPIMRHLTVDEIRQALGGIFSFHLNL
jgi:hypothetical protein